MILKSIEMQGFKSFPDKTVLELGKGITGVVGPNGSGKSNISDAMRWVLGEQSTKALRGARMEDVIFNGTAKRKSLGFAEVTLRLDNTDRTIDQDVDEIAVTRRYYRSGESEYKINGETRRLRDIHEMFMDTGLGRDGYSLVSQGRIADLVSAKSSQRRDMLEEASGISHYRYRRADAKNRLKLAEDNLVRLRDILSEVEKQVGPLKTQSEKAKKYLALSAEKKELEIGLWLNSIEKSEKSLLEHENKLSIVNAQYEDTEKNLSSVEEEIDASTQKGQDLTVEVENLRKVITDCEKGAAETEGLIAVENNSVENNRATVIRLEADMGAGEKSVAEKDEQIAQTQEEIDRKQLEVDEKKAELAAELKKINDLFAQTAENSDKIEEINAKLTEAAMRLSDLRVEKSTASSTIAELETRIETIDCVLKDRGGIVEELQKEKSKASEDIRKLKDEEDSNNNSIDGYRLIIETKQNKADKIREEVDSLRLDIYQKNERIKMLDDLEKNLDGYAGSVQKVIKEAKRGALRGIKGTVSQLISTTGKYSVAVETALGAAVQNIITDDENAAKMAIEFLKTNRAGRATFLPLTSVKPLAFKEKGLDECDGYIDLASNLVECDKQYKGIIESLLGRTAVVENIDDGIAMAKKFSYRFKIVTLDGQVLNAGGSMTGGSRGSGAGFLSRINEIEELKEDVKILSSKLEEKQKKYDSVLAEVNAAKAQSDASEAEAIKIGEKIIRAEGELQLIINRYDSAKSHMDELTQEKERSLLRIGESEKIIKSADSETEKLNKQEKELNAQLDELSGRKEEFDKIREESAQVQNELNIEIVSLGKEIEAYKNIIEAAERSKEELAGRGSQLELEINELKLAVEMSLQKIEELKAGAQMLRDRAAKTEEKIEQTIAGRNENEAAVVSLRGRERELNADKEKLGGERARLEERKESLEQSLENTKNKLYDEYQLTYNEALVEGTIPEDISKAQRTLQEIKGKIRALGDVNPGAIEEYKEVSERYEYLSGQLGDVEKSKTELEKLIDELTDKMSEKFREQFRLINNSFGETFRDLFSGGKAELELDDPTDVLECNVNIKVQPPGKNVQNIDLLSGGEKGLAAIALLFAILKVNPAPFCIFDEVEAALDDVNVTRYAKYVRSMTSSTQFILITHRRGTMEEADVLYGVTMQEEGVSKMLELKSYEMAAKLGLDN